MNVLLCAVILTLSSAGVVDQNADHISLLRADTTKKGHPLSLWMYNIDGPDADFCAGLNYSDAKMAKSSGKKPIRFHFPADWDGDGVDELVLVREKMKSKDHRLRLSVYRMPQKIWDDTGKPVASSKGADLGAAVGDGRVVLVGAGNVDGTGPDEVIIVRETDQGDQLLEVRGFPAGKNKPMGVPLRSDLTFGHVNDSINVALLGADLQGDGLDEILVIRRAANGTESLLAFEPPQWPLSETGNPVASYKNVTAPAGWATTSVARIYMDDHGPDHIVFTQTTPAGQQRLRLHPLPQALDLNLGAPAFSDETPGYQGADVPILTAFGFRNNPPPQPLVPTLNGPFLLSFQYVKEAADPTAWTGTIGPFGGAFGQYFSTKWKLNMDGMGLILQGTVYGGVTAGSLVTFPAAKISYPVTTASEIAQPGDVLVFTYNTGMLSLDAFGVVTVAGTNALGGTCEIQDSTGTKVRDLSGFSFTRQY